MSLFSTRCTAWVASLTAAAVLVALLLYGSAKSPPGDRRLSGAGRPFLHRPACTGSNPALARLMKQALREDFDDRLLPGTSSDYSGFLDELKASLEKHHLPVRPIDLLFNAAEQPAGRRVEPVHPSCAGDFMELGVFTAESTNKTARWKARNCHASCGPVYGMDTFTGLPEKWGAEGSPEGIFQQGAFSLDGVFPAVEENIQLVKGLFSESIPPLLGLQRELGGGHTHDVLPLSYLHIDCDLYAGARDGFTLLSHKIVPGTVLLFDELVNYRTYREHEARALWEWLHVSGAKIATIGMQGPLPDRDYAFDKDITVASHEQPAQSAAFVVVHKPEATQRIAW